MDNELEPIVLSNGLTVRFVDQSNRYFGDFHRIYIEVQICLPDHMELPVGFSREKTFLKKTLEKMGVPTEALERERKLLIDAFLATGRTYLEKDDFPQRLLFKLQQEKQRPVFLRN